MTERRTVQIPEEALDLARELRDLRVSIHVKREEMSARFNKEFNVFLEMTNLKMITQWVKLGDAMGMDAAELSNYNLQATYLDDCDIAFLDPDGATEEHKAMMERMMAGSRLN